MSEKFTTEQYEEIKKLVGLEIEKEDFEKVLEIYQQALKKYDSQLDLLVDLGNVFSDQEKYDEALKYYLKAYELDNNSWRVYHNLGLTYSRLKDYEKAINFLHKALEVEPDSYLSNMIMGNVYSKTNEDKKAIESYKKAISIDEKRYDARYFLAKHYQQNKNWEEEIRILEGILSQMPEDLVEDYYRTLAKAYYEKGDYEKSIPAYLKLLEITDKPKFIHYRLGSMYKALQDFEKAVFHFKSELDFNPSSQNTWEEMVYCLTSLGRIDETISYSKEAHIKFEKSDLLLSHLMWNLASNGQIDEALNYENKLLLLKPDDHVYLAMLGLIYTKANKSDLAVRYFKKAIGLCSKSDCAIPQEWIINISNGLNYYGEFDLKKKYLNLL